MINNFSYDETLNFILCSCALSTLVFQGRYNKYYLNIRPREVIFSDFLAWRNEVLIKTISEKYFPLIKFEKDKGGKAFIIFSIKKDGKKEIYNPEIIDKIKKVLDIC